MNKGLIKLGGVMVTPLLVTLLWIALTTIDDWPKALVLLFVAVIVGLFMAGMLFLLLGLTED